MQYKLDEVTKITMGQSPKSINYTDNPNDNILVQGNADLVDKQVSPRIWTTEVTKKATKGDIILTVRAPVGEVAKTQFNVVLGRGVASLNGNDFIYHLLHRMQKNHFWKRYSTGSTFESINSNDIKTAVIFAPKQAEQNSIGKILNSLDSTITLEQEKLNRIQKLYTSLVQLLLIVTDNNEPIIRLQRYSDQWRLLRVSDIFQLTRGNVLARSEISKEKNREFKYPVYSSQTLNEGLMGYYNDYLFENAITWTTDGANAGTVNYRHGKFFSTNVNGVLLSTEGYACKAIAEIINNVAYKYVSYIGNPKLMNNIMADIPIYIPSNIKELHDLSNIFLKLEDSINILKNSIQSYIEIKEYFLINIFI